MDYPDAAAKFTIYSIMVLRAFVKTWGIYTKSSPDRSIVHSSSLLGAVRTRIWFLTALRVVSKEVTEHAGKTSLALNSALSPFTSASSWV